MKKHYIQHIFLMALMVGSIHTTWASAPGEFSALVSAAGRKLLCYRPAAPTAAAANREISRTQRKFGLLDLSNNPCFFCSTSDLYDQAVARRFVMGLPPHVTMVDVSNNRLPYNALIAWAPWFARKNSQFLNVRNNNRGADSDDAKEHLYRYYLNKGMSHQDIEEAMNKIVWAPPVALSDFSDWDVLSPDSHKAHRQYDALVGPEPKEPIPRATGKNRGRQTYNSPR